MPDITVYFATNREEIVSDGTVVGFGQGLNPKSPLWLRYGSADMHRPGRRRTGPFGTAQLRVAPEVIPGVTADGGEPPLLGSASVYDTLRKRLIETEADLVLLLHGFGCSFEGALTNAADIRTEWASKGRPLEIAVFSWPADGEVTPWISYASDRDDARSSAKAVARALLNFLSYLQSLGPGEWCRANMHLVAHSMGAYTLRNAVQAMISELGGRAMPRVFKNIFLMAPDEDSDAFEHADKLARLPELAESVSVYFARNDLALSISDRTKGHPDRLGSTGPRTITNLPQKVTLVDCANVSETSSVTDARHHYYRRRPEVVEDVRQVLAGVPGEAIAGREWIPARHCFRIDPAAS